jgi:GNAT superfamily N-acetyltransferase
MGITPEGEPKAAYTRPEPITADHRLDGFACGKQFLDDWLIARAIKSEAKSARTFVVTSRTEPDAGRVIAYYALATGSVAREDVPKKIRQGPPNPTPILVLARLAVDKRHGSKGIGSALLRDAMLRALEISKSAGVRALIVHAIDEDAIGFYAKYGFQPFPAGAKTMFLPIETLVQSLTAFRI